MSQHAHRRSPSLLPEGGEGSASGFTPTPARSPPETHRRRGRACARRRRGRRAVVRRRRAALRHLEQRAVGEDHEGGDALVARESRGGACAEARTSRRRRSPSSSAPPCAPVRAARSRGSRSAQQDRLAPAQDGVALFGQREAAMLDAGRRAAPRRRRAGGRSSDHSALLRSRADAEGLQLVVVVAAHRLARLAGQHVGEVAGAEALAGAADGREDLLRVHRAVASVTSPRQRSQAPQGSDCLAEIGEQRLAAAGRRLAEATSARQAAGARCGGARRERPCRRSGGGAAPCRRDRRGVSVSPAGRRGRRGRSPGSSSRRWRACRHGRRSARPAC